MKAAVYSRYGPPEVVQIQDVDKPIPKDNEVLVRVHAATVCAADYRLRKASPAFVRLFTGLLRPKTQILGMEFSGSVESFGKSVTKFAAGDQVFGLTGVKLGTHAEYVCQAEDRTAIKPVNMPLDESAAVLFGGVTALYTLKLANIQPGQRVLIYGASGSVGVFAVQLAKHFGAHVTAVCSTANLELAKSLGADEVIDYTREDFSKAGPIYDVVYDTVGFAGFSRCIKSLKRGGTCLGSGWDGKLSSMFGGMLGGLWVSLTGRAKSKGGVTRPAPDDQSFLKGLIEAGKLRTVIDRRYPLAQISEAHRYAESGRKKGHVLILLEPTS
jgi:NADPH:quinone reductase-like Zn-dependent oxidoreductase